MKTLAPAGLASVVFWLFAYLSHVAAQTTQFEEAVTTLLKEYEALPDIDDRFDYDKIDRNNRRLQAVQALGTVEALKESLNRRLNDLAHQAEWPAILELTWDAEESQRLQWLRLHMQEAVDLKDAVALKWIGRILRTGTREDIQRFRQLTQELPAGLKSYASDLARRAEVSLVSRGMMKLEDLKLPLPSSDTSKKIEEKATQHQSPPASSGGSKAPQKSGAVLEVPEYLWLVIAGVIGLFSSLAWVAFARRKRHSS